MRRRGRYVCAAAAGATFLATAIALALIPMRMNPLEVLAIWLGLVFVLVTFGVTTAVMADTVVSRKRHDKGVQRRKTPYCSGSGMYRTQAPHDRWQRHVKVRP